VTDDLRDLVGSGPAGFSDVLRRAGHLPPDLVSGGSVPDLGEATTILAVRWPGGIVMVGDRQATEGYTVAHRRIRKVFAADDFSAVAISGTAGLAVEMVRLFQTELEHYEKIEDTRLSLDGKATFLARMVRNQLPLAMQGLVVVPLFAGYDEHSGTGRLYSFDVVGGRYEEQDFAATGSGGREARSTLRAGWAEDLDAERAVALALQALVVAAEQDVATAGPDLRRGILPVVVVVDEAGFREVDDDEIADVAATVLEGTP
jgi:proteasome beta subunit